MMTTIPAAMNHRLSIKASRKWQHFEGHTRIEDTRGELLHRLRRRPQRSGPERRASTCEHAIVLKRLTALGQMTEYGQSASIAAFVLTTGTSRSQATETGLASAWCPQARRQSTEGQRTRTTRRDLTSKTCSFHSRHCVCCDRAVWQWRRWDMGTRCETAKTIASGSSSGTGPLLALEV
jgi:hypothetical protein